MIFADGIDTKMIIFNECVIKSKGPIVSNYDTKYESQENMDDIVLTRSRFNCLSVSDVNLTDGAENSKYDHVTRLKTMANVKARTTSESLLLLPRQGRVKVSFLLTQISKVREIKWMM